MRMPPFRIQTLMIAVAAGAFMLGAGIALSNAVQSRSFVVVHVLNQTDTPLHDVALQFTGGSAAATAILPKQTATWSIRVRGESDLVLSYRDKSGKISKTSGNAYVESGYYGSFDFLVGGKTIETIDRIKAWP